MCSGLGDQYKEALLKAVGQVVEVCEPELKGQALSLAGSVLLLSPPDFLSEGVNNVLDLALHFLISTQQWAL